MGFHLTPHSQLNQKHTHTHSLVRRKINKVKRHKDMNNAHKTNKWLVQCSHSKSGWLAGWLACFHYHTAWSHNVILYIVIIIFLFSAVIFSVNRCFTHKSSCWFFYGNLCTLLFLVSSTKLKWNKKKIYKNK